MPLPFVFSSNNMFGAAYTRVKGLMLSGTWVQTTDANSEGPAGIALIQPAAACTTGASYNTGVQTVSTASAARAFTNFVYIPQTTGAIATSSFAAAEGAPPQTSMGAALIFDAANRRLGIYSTAGGSGTWFFSHTGITTSAGAAGFTSS